MRRRAVALLNLTGVWTIPESLRSFIISRIYRGKTGSLEFISLESRCISVNFFNAIGLRLAGFGNDTDYIRLLPRRFDDGGSCLELHFSNEFIGKRCCYGDFIFRPVIYVVFTFFCTGNDRKRNRRCERKHIWKTSHNHKRLEFFKINPVFFEIFQLRRLRLTEACFNRKVQFDDFRAGIFSWAPDGFSFSCYHHIIWF